MPVIRSVLRSAFLVLVGCSAQEMTSSAPDGPIAFPPDGPVVVSGPPWGAEALPPGAEVVTPDEMAVFAAEDGFQFITRAGIDDASGHTLATVAAARQMIDSLAAGDPTLSRLVPRTPAESSDLHSQADGNYRLNLGGSTVVLHGTDWLYREVATSVTRTPSRANREADYRSLIGLLPGDQRADLPAADGLASLPDDALAVAQAELLRRIETGLPSEALLASDMAAKRPLVDSGCPNLQLNDFYTRLTWPLKAYTTPVRDQGARGTCVAHAVIGALETRIFRTRGLTTDYSEQELYAIAKGTWFPTSDAYGDGLYGEDVLDKLATTGGRLDAERRWPYNPSESRVDDEDDRTYTHSCDGYGNSYCSNTNHQMRIVCSGSGASRTCGTRLPPGVTGLGNDPVVLTGWVSIWNGFSPEASLASIRAHLIAGHPVVLAIEADDRFKDAAELAPNPSGGALGPGIVNWPGGGDAIGGHELAIVGYVANGQLPPGVPGGDAFGGGYLIGKNSWGCKGDGGYMYLAYDWVIDQAVGAFAVTDVATDLAAPEAGLTVNKSLLSAPGNVQLTVAVDAHTTKVQIFRGLGSDHQVLAKTLPGGAPDSVTAIDGFIDGGQNGIYIYWALATDQFGNAAASNQVGVRVLIDGVAPQIQLSAESDHVLAPGQVVLHATASDNVGVVRVKFYRGFQLIGEDATAPYSIAHTVLPGDVGSWLYVAIAVDAAGNQKMSAAVPVSVIVKPLPLVTFSVTPTTLPAGGGSATLSWNVAGANTVTISPGVGAVSAQGTRAVTVTQSTTFALSATNGEGTSTATASVTVPVIPPPIIQSFTANPSSLPAGGGNTTLSFSVLGSGTTLSIDHGVGGVTGLTAKTVAVAATTTFRLTATNASGTSTRDVTVTVATTMTSPPIIATFTASPSSLPVGGGSSTLSWSVTGTQPALAIDQGVGNVTGLSQKSVTVGATKTFRLTATNAAGSVFRDATVTVAATGSLSVYASPGGSDTGNNCQDQAAPCQTIARAVAQVAAGGTVFLLDGGYTEASCGGCAEIVVPNGVTVRSVNPGGAHLGSKILMTGATLAEIVIDRTLGFARVRITGGTNTLQGIRWKGPFAGSGADTAGLELTGTAVATLEPGMAANYAAETTSENSAYYALAAAIDSARLTVNGGTFDGPGVGYGSNPNTNATPGAFVVANTATLVFDHVTLRTVNRGIMMLNSATVRLLDSTVAARSMTFTGWGIRVNNNTTDTATIEVQDSQISGFAATDNETAAISVFANGGSAHAAITLTRSTLSTSSLGFYASALSSVSLDGSDVSLDDNFDGGIRAVGATVDIDIEGGSLSRNGVATTGTVYGGMTVGGGSNHVRLRGVAVQGNKSTVMGASTAGDSGLTLAGDATSTFDLGTGADPGGNSITGNTTSASTTGIVVTVNAAVTVQAVGNTFAAGVQGADAAGHYLLGSSPCGPSTCDVTSGTGANYRVVTGTLRLAQ